MRILVDADACPVKQIIVRIAKERQIPVIMLTDTSHALNDGYSRVITVDKAADSKEPGEQGRRGYKTPGFWGVLCAVFAVLFAAKIPS